MYILYFPPNPGELIQFGEHNFQMGWFNHQLVQFEYLESFDDSCFGLEFRPVFWQKGSWDLFFWGGSNLMLEMHDEYEGFPKDNIQ